MLTVLGYKRSSGTYEGNAYDNYIIHCVRNASFAGEVGQITEVVKVKVSLLDNPPVIGSVINVAYDRFGRVQAIDVSTDI